MEILKEIRKSNEKINTSWFMMNEKWYCFSNNTLYTQDKSKTGPESIVEIASDDNLYNEVKSHYMSKR